MLKIGEFSKRSRVPVKTLRYYDEIGLLKPVVVDKYSHYRYYSEDQLTVLNRIIVLKNLGLTLQEVAELVVNKMPDDRLVQLLNIKRVEIGQRLHDYRMRLELVEEWVRQISKENSTASHIVVKKLEKQTVAFIHRKLHGYEEIPAVFGEIYDSLRKQKTHITGPPLSLFYDMEYKLKDVDIEAAFPISGSFRPTGAIRVREIPEVEKAACLMHRGPYETSLTAYRSLTGWLFTNGYHLASANREVYIKGMLDTRDPRKYVTELQFPITGW